MSKPDVKIYKVLDFYNVMSYIREEFGIEFYNEFDNWFYSRHNVNNDSMINIYVDDINNEFHKFLKETFPEALNGTHNDIIRFWVSW